MGLHKKTIKEFTPRSIINDRVDEYIVLTLKKLKVPTDYIGYEFLKMGISEVLENPNSVYYITTIYDKIAHKFNTTVKKVGNCLSYTIQISIDNISEDNDILSIENGKIKPSRYISDVAEFIRLELGLYRRDKEINIIDKLYGDNTSIDTSIDESNDKIITQVMKDLKISEHYKGYRWVKMAIIISLKEPNLARSIMKICDIISMEENVPSDNVYRNIRDTILTLMDNMTTKELEDIKIITLDSTMRMTPSIFISNVISYIHKVQNDIDVVVDPALQEYITIDPRLQIHINNNKFRKMSLVLKESEV